MAGANFTHGSLVLRVWAFDGSGEVLAKFQYFDDAVNFAANKAAAAPKECSFFFLAVCDHNCELKSFFPETLDAALSKARESRP